jgi:imidazole glycerol-phosphate synthase subunit HisH
MGKNKKVVIIDYNMGNLFSVYQACTFLGYNNTTVTNNKEEVSNADYLILPGVGAFGDAIDTLHKHDLVMPIKDFIASGKPFLGVCLGLQLLFTESEEFGNHKGLDIINGSVKRFSSKDKSGNKVKIPQIEWNQIACTNEHLWTESPLKNCMSGDYMYFVHSYYVVPLSNDIIVSSTEYGDITYCSSLIKGNVFACQFHPEKSAENGLNIYNTFLSS